MIKKVPTWRKKVHELSLPLCSSSRLTTNNCWRSSCSKALPSESVSILASSWGSESNGFLCISSICSPPAGSSLSEESSPVRPPPTRRARMFFCSKAIYRRIEHLHFINRILKLTYFILNTMPFKVCLKDIRFGIKHVKFKAITVAHIRKAAYFYIAY